MGGIISVTKYSIGLGLGDKVCLIICTMVLLLIKLIPVAKAYFLLNTNMIMLIMNAVIPSPRWVIYLNNKSQLF